MIETEGARLARLVDDLLDLSRIQAGAVQPRADWCDLHDVVASGGRPGGRRAFARVRAPGRPAARARRRRAARAGVLEPDRERDQVLAARRAGADHRRRRRRPRHGPRDRRGRGIAPQHRAHVFEPFFRGRGARRRRLRPRARDLPRLRRSQRRPDRAPDRRATAARRSRSASRSSRQPEAVVHER